MMGEFTEAWVRFAAASMSDENVSADSAAMEADRMLAQLRKRLPALRQIDADDGNERKSK